MENTGSSIDSKILWHEGMLLVPQHFQMQDDRFEELITYHHHNSTPFYWGIKKIVTDEISLAKGSFRITELEAIMPDGTVVFFNSKNSFELVLDISHYKEFLKTSSLVVYLAVVAKNEFSNTVKGEIGRYYSAEGLIIEDQNCEGNNQQVPVLKNRLILLAGDLPSKKYSSFPIAKVSLNGNVYQLGEFIPPTIIVKSETKLHSIIEAVIAKLRDKSYYLVNKLSKLPDPLIPEVKTQISSIVAFLPFLEAQAINQCATPYELYKTLALVLGHISSLSQTLIPPPIPKFDQDNLDFTFNAFQTLIYSILEEEVSENYLSIPFHHDKTTNEFRVKIENEWINKPLIIGLLKQSSNPDCDVVHWLEQSLISSENVLNLIMEKRILGLKRNLKEKDDSLIASNKVIFFTLTNDAEYLKPDESLIIFNPMDFDNTNTPEEIRIYIKNK